MKILFMCVANSARSQMAEGLAKKILGDQFEVQSAGSNPSKLNPFAVQALKELNLDISKHHSKSIQDLPENFTQNLNYVITLCADEVCPVIFAPSARRLHWPFMDPATQEKITDQEMISRFRQVNGFICADLVICEFNPATQN